MLVVVSNIVDYKYFYKNGRNLYIVFNIKQ